MFLLKLKINILAPIQQDAKLNFKKSAATSRTGPGSFQGPSVYPQLCWWSLIEVYPWCPYAFVSISGGLFGLG